MLVVEGIFHLAILECLHCPEKATIQGKTSVHQSHEMVQQLQHWTWEFILADRWLPNSLVHKIYY